MTRSPLGNSDNATRDWKPAREQVRVEDIMDSREYIAQEPVLYALRAALSASAARRARVADNVLEPAETRPAA